jgi:hypothetical protein
MIPKDIEEREIKYVESLSKAEQIETKILELKSALPGDTREQRIEFLKDVSSLANTAGGDLILGVQQDKGTGRIINIPGIDIGNVDQEILRLENILRDGLRPRILSKDILPIPWADSKIVLIIRIPQSSISPHRVVYGGHDKFYGRCSTGSYPLDVDELRVAFNYSQTVIEKIKEFRYERLARIIADDTPMPFEGGKKRIIHLIPVNSLSSFNQYDLTYFHKNMHDFRPLHAPSWDTQYNLEGIISFYVPSVGGKCYSYIQIYRNGIIESVCPEYIDDNIFYIGSFERDMVGDVREPGYLRYLLSILQKLGIPPNLLMFISFSGMKGIEVTGSPQFDEFIRRRHILNRDLLSLPELPIEQFDINPGKLLRPFFNLIWNAWGHPFSPNYDKEGNWKLSR